MNPVFRNPAIFQGFPRLLAVETTRHGGVSTAPYDSLNLGINTNDLPQNVTENYQLIFEKLGIEQAQVATALQVHGETILVATQGGRFDGYDAIISNTPNVFVGITVADCTPVLVYDSQNQAVAAIHAGWRGTVAQLVHKTLLAMRAHFGTQSQHCHAYVGTCIDACDFEVGAEVAGQFLSDFKIFNPAQQRYYVNLKAANAAQLRAFGVPENQIEISEFSTTHHNQDYFSYRRENGQTGRMLALLGQQLAN